MSDTNSIYKYTDDYEYEIDWYAEDWESQFIKEEKRFNEERKRNKEILDRQEDAL